MLASCGAVAPAGHGAGNCKNQGYWLLDRTGGIVRAVGAGVCVRTSQWTPARARLPRLARVHSGSVPETPPPPLLKPHRSPKPSLKRNPKPKPEARAKPQMMNIERKIELQGMPFDKAEMTPDNEKELDKFLAMISSR